MSHATHDARCVLEAAAARLGVSVATVRLGACADLAEWVAPAAARLGLTQFASPGEFAENLMVPALHLLRYIPPSVSSVAEVGPGSGGLGLTVAILLPNCRVSLLDRRQRVCGFLTLVCTRFGIGNCRVLRCDLRDRTTPPETYDLVTARAVTSPEVLLEHLPRLLGPGGRFALFRSATDLPPAAGFRLVVHESTGVAGLWLDIYAAAGCGDTGDVAAGDES